MGCGCALELWAIGDVKSTGLSDRHLFGWVQRHRNFRTQERARVPMDACSGNRRPGCLRCHRVMGKVPSPIALVDVHLAGTLDSRAIRFVEGSD